MKNSRVVSLDVRRKKSLTYSSYLKVPDLLSLQKPLSNPPAHDELLFIIVHQTYELWFKQVVFEVESFIEEMQKVNYLSCAHRAHRVTEILRLLVQQIDILETMPPTEFNRFRSHLNPASGFQSYQFRELELLLGGDIAQYERFWKLNPEWKEFIKQRKHRKNVRDALQILLAREAVEGGSLVEQLRHIYEESRFMHLQSLCEGLIRLDELFQLWRFRHVQMVERMIGHKPGTGGSLGVSYLASTLTKRFFPELWEVRTQLATGLTYGVPPKARSSKTNPKHA